jgi:GNAT superfamily N-acetyltransferase
MARDADPSPEDHTAMPDQPADRGAAAVPDQPGDRGAGVEIVPLGRERLGEVGAVFAASHREYPTFRHVFPDPRRRAVALRAFFTATVRDALTAGRVEAAVAGGRLLGVAIWLPPGAFPWSAARQLKSAPAMLRVLAAAPGAFPTFMRYGANAARLHPRDRHWNLETMGLHPDAQGRGIGSRLIAPGLARADRDRLPCYLTTGRRENLRFYERFGFVVEHDALQLVPGGPTSWGMRRAPRPASPGTS